MNLSHDTAREPLPEIERLRWQCRRGLLELDYLLEAFLEQEYPRIGPVEQDAFIALLHHDDPDLQLWLLGDELPAHAALKAVVKRMRALRI